MHRFTPLLSQALRAGLAAIATAGLLACSSTGPSTAPSTGSGTGKSGAAPQAKPLFIRPAAGTTLSRFNGKSNKGLDIAGSAGDPVLAAADGRVVYAGSQLRGYGSMVIVKHNETFITAYAHNQALLVKENDIVRQGQKIAEMGKTEADRVKLHFELRKDGNAVDPEPYLSGKLR
ncbi:murein hydrolase activator EnvC family protein [Variovorax sp. ZT4R33]|uniref:murein hydrolase activator EnvC family protein n=1 Tax=Variovorax sp. ZT4R33 TaxID=3443743 RepID=UPI003F48AFEB